MLNRALLLTVAVIVACGSSPPPPHGPAYPHEDFNEHDSVFTEHVFEIRRARMIVPRAGFAPPCADAAACAPLCARGDGWACVIAGDDDAACKARDPEGCARLAHGWFEGATTPPADAYALLYVACADGHLKEACALAIDVFSNIYARAIADPEGVLNRTRFDEFLAYVRPPGGQDFIPAPQWLGTQLEHYACEQLLVASVCLANDWGEAACRAGDQPSCETIAAAERELEAYIKASDEAAESARLAREYEESHPDGPTEVTYEEPHTVASEDADYLNLDECKMAVSFECSHLYAGDHDRYAACYARIEGLYEHCTRIRCGADFYNCQSAAYTPEAFRACAQLADVCGQDPL